MNFAQVLREELDLITLRRRQVRELVRHRTQGFGGVDAAAAADGQTDGPPPVAAQEAAAHALPEPEKELRLEAMGRHLAGLALSGGGIRSATFALGVLQGLADLKILNRFDYLSTVSGGGYIGGWLAAWLKREGDPLAVEDQLSPSRIEEAKVQRDVIGANRIVDEEPEPVHHLRSYSNYLTPRPGLLSVDTWTVLTIYVRNSLINLLLLLPLTMVPVLLGRFVVLFYGVPGREEWLRAGVFWAFVGLFLVAVLSLGVHVSRIRRSRPNGHGKDKPPKRIGPASLGFNLTILWPLVACAALACWSFSLMPPNPDEPAGPAGEDDQSFVIRVPGPLPGEKPQPVDGVSFPTNLLHRAYNWIANLQPDANDSPFGFLGYFLNIHSEVYCGWHEGRSFLLVSALEFALAFGLCTLAIHVLGYPLVLLARPAARGRPRGSRLYDFLRLSVAAFTAGFTGGFLLLTLFAEVLWRVGDRPNAVVTIGPPLALAVFVAATFVEVWLLARWQADDLREWWARVCAWVLIYAAGWFAFFGITLYGPVLVDWLRNYPGLRSGAFLGWLATAAGGAFAGRSREAKREDGSWMLKVLLTVAPPVFLVGLLVAVSALADGVAARLAAGAAAAQAPVSYADRLTGLAVALAVSLGLAVLAGIMSNVNLFSLNAMYASRLMRCYLGASRRKWRWDERGGDWKSGRGGAPTGGKGARREPNPITGFDPEDDMPLRALKIGAVTAERGAGGDAEQRYFGPHLIVNTALNLVAGAELAWQDRKAESFILTPLHCGSKGTGYAPTGPGTARELTLGRAVSISGAAVDSNVGLHQSSALIALMTAFNARLGWWVQNPNLATQAPWRGLGVRGAPAWEARSPSVAWPLVWELLGQTDENKEWVHISDGGHFENLAVYELVRRRCRYIVCCDAGTDQQASDDNLAAMVRLCRIDFGVRIELDTAPLARQGPERLSRWHCAVGKIRYDDVDGGELPGLFVYLRTSLTGDEPPDVQEYAAKHPDFPWQSTLDQFYNEPQFESYRALGFHVAQSAFKGAVEDLNGFEPLWSNSGAETEFRRGNQRLFGAVQRQWTSSPPGLEAAFDGASRDWSEFHGALRSERDLVELARDIYPESPSEAGPGDGNGRIEPQLSAVAQMIQVMENAWAGLRQAGFRDVPMNRGWMTVFRRWASTKALRRHWPVLRGEFSNDFVKFCETNLRLGSLSEPVPRSQLDNGFVDRAMKLLGHEFALEWPGQPPLGELIAEAEKSWRGRGAELPIQFFLQAPRHEEPLADAPGKFPCGVVFARALPTPCEAGGCPERFEVFLWMRRAYRGLGIVSRSAKRILTNFRNTIQGTNGRRPVTLVVRYPEEGARPEDMEYLLWRNFLSHYDFSFPPNGARSAGGYRVVERTFAPDEPEI